VRIIGGRLKRTTLLTTDAPELRPMLDRVREALFNIMHHVTPGCHVLDLFSGCGSLGLEALSRGAVHCVFVEYNPRLARLVRENVVRCRAEDRALVLTTDVLSLAGRPLPRDCEPADLVLADPPYEMVNDPNRRARLFEGLERLIGTWIDTRADLILHHEPLPYALWPTSRLRQWDQRIYGRSQLTFFEVADAEAADGQ
jgi:16S rRNA (guanine966-N2)-methyltransferase